MRGRNGIEFIELKVAVDGLSVDHVGPGHRGRVPRRSSTSTPCSGRTPPASTTGPTPTPVADEIAATVTDLGAINTPYPDAALTVTAPGEESGTFDSFVELVHRRRSARRSGVEDATVRPDYTASPNDNVIIEGIGANPTSLGWVGFAFVEENLDDGQAAAGRRRRRLHRADAETIASGEYPIARDLYIYVNVAEARGEPGARGRSSTTTSTTASPPSSAPRTARCPTCR